MPNIWPNLWATYQKAMQEEYFERCSLAEFNREREAAAAIEIQRLWRGALARMNYKRLTINAIKIQITVRAYLAKRNKEKKMINQEYEQRMAAYDYNSTLIQKIWRGYRSRKNKFDYYARKKYLLDLAIKMQSMRKYLVQRQKEMKDLKKKAENEKRIEALDKLASMKHHLIGTKSILGTCSSRKGVSSEDEIQMQLTDQLLLESSGLKEIKDNIHKQIRQAKKFPAPEVVPESEKSKFAQGPFLTKYEVNKLKLKPLKPTLRVETDYYGSREFKREEIRQNMALILHRGPPQPSSTKGVWKAAEIFLVKEPYTAPTPGPFREEVHFPRGVFRVKLAPIKTFDDC